MTLSLRVRASRNEVLPSIFFFLVSYPFSPPPHTPLPSHPQDVNSFMQSVSQSCMHLCIHSHTQESTKEPQDHLQLTVNRGISSAFLLLPCSGRLSRTAHPTPAWRCHLSGPAADRWGTDRPTEYSAQPSRSTLAPKLLTRPQRNNLPSPLPLPASVSHPRTPRAGWLRP